MKPRYSIVVTIGRTVKIFDGETLIGFFQTKDVLFVAFVNNHTCIHFKTAPEGIRIPDENFVEQILGYAS